MDVSRKGRSDKAEGRELGAYLRDIRNSFGLSLRAVEQATGKRVTNGYLSQIENGDVARPSPNVLYQLAEVYKIDYGDLLVRAGHRVPRSEESGQRLSVGGLPLRALEELTEEERAELLQYLAFIRARRATRGDDTAT